MLSNEVMGPLALAILWVNVLLVAAACAQQIRAVLARRAALAGARRGRIARGDGPDGVLAAHRVEQVGRAGAGAIHFHDRRTEDEVFGGVVALDDGGEIAVADGAPAEIWIGWAALTRAAACPSPEVLQLAHAAAQETPGFTRAVTATLAAGDPVFVDAPTERPRAFPDRAASPLLLAAMDPRALLTRKAALGAAFIVAEIGAAAGCTALALSTPTFGTTSKLGAAACLAFFFIVQPAGTRVRDALLVPGRLPLRGRWRLSPPVSPPPLPAPAPPATALLRSHGPGQGEGAGG